MGDGILGQHRNAVGGDQFRNAMIDFRIQMIGTTGKNDSLHVMLFQIGEDFFSLFLSVQADLLQFLPGMGNCTMYFRFRDLLEFLYQRGTDCFLGSKRHKRIA